MSRISFIIAILLTLIASAVFLAFPGIDLKVAAYFYTAPHHFLLETTLFDRLRDGLYFFVYFFALLILVLIVIKIRSPHKHYSLKSCLYLLAVFILVPLLLVNSLLKDHSGRPRPRNVTEFGSTALFQPVFHFSQECSDNCSFVCGDSSVIYAFIALLAFIKKRYRRYLYGSFIFLLGSFYGFIRIGQGGHFLSDVVFSALFCYLGVYMVWWFFYGLNPKWLRENTLQQWITRRER
jgi:lipid A 4'-phosphatase